MSAKKKTSNFHLPKTSSCEYRYISARSHTSPVAPGQPGYNVSRFGFALVAAIGASTAIGAADANSTFDTVGLTQLQQIAPQLTGSGVVVGQVEASTVNYNLNLTEPNPVADNQNPAIFSFVNSTGALTTQYQSAEGSSHATNVGDIFYGGAGYGIADGVSGVYAYSESWYQQNLTNSSNATASSLAQYAPPGTVDGSATYSSPAVVNQSFIIFTNSGGYSAQIDSYWDNYAALYNTLYVSAIGDGQTTDTTSSGEISSYVNPPSDMYNGIAVGVYNGTVQNGAYGPSSGTPASWVGPTYDGRSKPDLVAPAPALGAWTSYTTPIVSGVATLMVQAGRGTDLAAPVGLSASDSSIANGSTTAYITAATDIRTVKALLLNGAVKPVGWTNSYTVNNGNYTYNAVNTNAVTPFDPRYGSGVVNAYNSYENLAGGEHNYSSATSQSIAALPSVTSSPTANFSGSVSEVASATNPATVTGWNLATIAATSTSNAVENYDFNLTGASVNSWDLTATLTWNKDYNASGINHLMLFLLNSSGRQVASSTSMLDNVQQININPALGINSLAPGQYDLAVEMLGGVNAISTSDTYALAWNVVDPTTVPEPAALATFAIGLAMSMLPRKRKLAGQRA